MTHQHASAAPGTITTKTTTSKRKSKRANSASKAPIPKTSKPAAQIGKPVKRQRSQTKKTNNPTTNTNKRTKTTTIRQLFDISPGNDDSTDKRKSNGPSHKPNPGFTTPEQDPTKSPNKGKVMSKGRRKKLQRRRQKFALRDKLAAAQAKLSDTQEPPSLAENETTKMTSATTPPLPQDALLNLIQQQATALQTQQEMFTKLMAATQQRNTSTSKGFRLKTNPNLKYKVQYASQLEADVFFADMDAAVMASSNQGQFHFRSMLTDTQPHPFYTSARFLALTCTIYGPEYVFDHTIHDDRAIAKRFEKTQPNLAKQLTYLIENGGETSWESRNTLIHQYYRAALPTNALYFLKMVPDNNGLALRALMKKQAQTIHFSDVKLATINTGKMLRDVKYYPATGLLRYFGDLASQLTILAGVGMTIEPGSFAELDLIGHIFDHLSTNNTALATKIVWIRQEVEANRYKLTYETVRNTLLLCERLHKGTTKPPKANNVSSGGGNNRNSRDGNRGGKHGRTPWKQEYEPAIIAALVAYSLMRFHARLSEQNKQPWSTSSDLPKCYNCAKQNPIARKSPRKPTNHTTEQCHTTLIRAYNSFTKNNACKTHPDGCHHGSECNSAGGSGKKPRRVNKVRQTATTPQPGQPSTPDDQIKIMMALPANLRAAYAQALSEE